MVAPVDPTGITGKHPGCCGRLNSDPPRIRYRYLRMTRLIKPLFPPPRSLWMDPLFVFSLKWASCMSWYVGSPSTLVRKVIKKEILMHVALDMVLDTILMVDSGS